MAFAADAEMLDLMGFLSFPDELVTLGETYGGNGSFVTPFVTPSR